VSAGKREVIDLLRSAFPTEPIRGVAAFAAWGGSYPDAAAYAQAIDGKTWEQLDRAYIVRRHDALGFLSTHELVQILPVYLLSLADEGVMSPALEAVLVKLAPPAREPAKSRFVALVKTLTAQQRAAVVRTLELVADQDPDGSPGRAARAALDSTWKESA
jgi:hypothetical protein